MPNLVHALVAHVAATNVEMLEAAAVGEVGRQLGKALVGDGRVVKEDHPLQRGREGAEAGTHRGRAPVGQPVGPPLYGSIALLQVDMTRSRLLAAVALLGGLSKKKLKALEKKWR